jgi:uncharacterized OB-fold protein
MTYSKPLPAIDNWNRRFWEGTRQNKLTLPRCTSCDHVFFPPGPVCPKCLSDQLEWQEVSGRGEVKSWVVFHQLYYKGFADELPYNVALIQLEEGPHLMSNIVGIDNADIRSGMKVEVVFEKATDEITIPKFKVSSHE